MVFVILVCMYAPLLHVAHGGVICCRCFAARMQAVIYGAIMVLHRCTLSSAVLGRCSSPYASFSGYTQACLMFPRSVTLPCIFQVQPAIHLPPAQPAHASSRRPDVPSLLTRNLRWVLSCIAKVKMQSTVLVSIIFFSLMGMFSTM